MTYDDILKRNAIALVKDHKKHCHDESCNITVYFIQVLLERAGIKLTKEEQAEFI